MPKPWQLVFLLMLLGSLKGETADQHPAEAQPDWPTIIAQLRQRVYQMPGHAETRKQLAIAYNNYGAHLADQGRFLEAVQQLEEAMRIDPSDAQVQHNLAIVYVRMAQAAYVSHQLQVAREAIERARALNPNEASAYVLLGEIEYNSQRLKEAREAWEQALALDPTRKDVREKLDRLKDELPVESRFERLSQAYFDIRYTETLERPAGFDIRDSLLQARRVVGSDFAFWPKQKLVVLLYSAEQFRQLRQDTPDWIAGQYDGKIRVPLPNQHLDQEAVTRILFHEYTHALVHQLTKNQCPTWFNEGLAEYEAWKQGRPQWPSLQTALAHGRLIPWANLSAQFSTTLSAQDVKLAYEQSHSIVSYLVQRYGFWRIRRVLQALANGTSLEETWATELHIKLPRLEAAWHNWLKETLGP